MRAINLATAYLPINQPISGFPTNADNMSDEVTRAAAGRCYSTAGVPV
jgi:hypothetical protein